MMRFRAVASDFDGTLTRNQQVSQQTLQGLAQARASECKLILVTGRVLAELCSVFPDMDLFDVIVAENGAVVYWPSTKKEKVLGAHPPDLFLERLRNWGVTPLIHGRSLVATVQSYEKAVRQVINELGLDLQIIFNREAVMVLPAGVNKGTGLAFALSELGIDSASVAGIGDAENDWDFLSRCGLSVAVANAIPSLKDRVHLVTAGRDGVGVVEALQRIVAGESFT
jgi:hydroxymethylpyrimidine pyrophosphatase-like HAD family hydrolase